MLDSFKKLVNTPVFTVRDFLGIICIAPSFLAHE